MDFSTWKPRAHYMGLLMTNGRGKSNIQKYNEAIDKKATARLEYNGLANKETETAGKLLQKIVDLGTETKRLEPIKDIPNLGETCKSKLMEIYVELTTGRKKVIESKYLEKGLMVEEDSITAYSIYTGNFHKKNELLGENDWITGTMDFEWEDIAIDTKSSWDIWTFNKSRYKKILDLYHWQLDVYMWLYDKDKGRLAYCLINTPEHLIRAEETKMMYRLFGNEQNFKMAPQYMLDAYEDAKADIRKNHIFDDLPLSEKIAVFDVERDEERVDQIKTRIEECRWFLNNIKQAEQDENESENNFSS